jgi:hypothetical protein
MASCVLTLEISIDLPLGLDEATAKAVYEQPHVRPILQNLCSGVFTAIAEDYLVQIHK